MKKSIVVIVTVFASLLSACASIFPATPSAGLSADTAGTALFQTVVAESLTAQSVPLPASATETPPALVASPTFFPSETPLPFPTFTFTLSPDLTTTPATATSDSAVATSGSAVATSIPAGATFTPTLLPGQVTASPTLGVRTYGTLPPAVPFNRITLVNKAKAEAYISLQVTMPDGTFSILEYPVKGWLEIKAPVGSYVYVAWVGGRKITGTFKMPKGDDLMITLYKDRIAIK